MVTLYRALRSAWYTTGRVFIAEPMFKAHCRSVGSNVHTGHFVHWVSGDGDILVGDDTTVDGKCTIGFGLRGSQRPVLRLGSRTYVGHACQFIMATEITIGDDVYIASQVIFMDSPGHPLDPQRRLAKLPPDPEQVRPIRVGNNAWIGTAAMIMPGVTIGEGSVVAARAVVTKDVPPYSLVGGTPARVLKSLEPANVDLSLPSFGSAGDVGFDEDR